MNCPNRNENGWYICAVMACGFIVFLSLPDGIPSTGGLAVITASNAGEGRGYTGIWKRSSLDQILY